MKLPEVMNIREGADRAESQAVQMWRRAEESLSPGLPLCQTAFIRDALQKRCCEGRPLLALPTSRKR